MEYHIDISAFSQVLIIHLNTSSIIPLHKVNAEYPIEFGKVWRQISITLRHKQVHADPLAIGASTLAEGVSASVFTEVGTLAISGIKLVHTVHGAVSGINLPNNAETRGVEARIVAQIDENVRAKALCAVRG